MELTNARGMKALAHRHEIYAIASEAYSSSDPVANVNVKEVMDWWLLLAGNLFEMGKLAKSQKR